jgi:tRNA dimethylallyltransferase
MALARRIGGEILSVDSMQVYRGMDVGTAKPSLAEQRDVRHHLIDVIDPEQPFTAARFVEMADAVIADAQKRRVPLIAVGGTPLYYKVLFEGMFEGPGADEAVRARLRDLPNDELHRRLTEVDPAAASRIHLNDTKRLIRALEVFELTGRPISAFQTEWETTGAAAGRWRHDAVWFGPHWDREALNRRINARVKAMMDAGWLDETCRLLDCYGAFSPTAGEATGYHELAEHLAGRMSLPDAVEQIKIGTRQLARRQMKWFRRWTQVTWLPGDRPAEQNVEAILQRWNPR